jgi:diguanylate cyclase (GGDEF)-like protein
MSALTSPSPAANVVGPASDDFHAAVPGSQPAPRLLIVDDISDNRAVLTRRFERRGFEIVETDNGLEALNLIDSQQFDLVLLDVMMPGIDGLETLRRIRKKKSQTVLPVIMVTAKAEGDNVVEALELGANDYVTKPVFFPAALARINTQLSRRKAELDLIATNQRLKAEIAGRKESEARSHFLAYHDMLTGLGNRLLFREHLTNALKESSPQHPVAVLLVDLDGFKAVNDTLGHSIGDLLLKSMAGRLRDAIGAGDRLARLGGDEFAILQVSAAQSETIALAEEIIKVVSEACEIEGHVVSVGASIGIATGQGGALGTETLLKSAEVAMYNAKADGRGTYRMFDPEMDAIAQLRRGLERDLRTALVQSGFRLFYQPLVDMQSKKVVAFEALMRWEHPDRGLVPPSEFIHVAEEMGLIVQLGEWALRQACAEAMKWPQDIRVSVNLSPLQFTKGNLAATVAHALASSGLPASRLELEITESVLFEDSDANVATLNQLRGLGVRISMDDFGTGYSSIGNLRSFPFDKIKIDQSFVKNLMVDEGSRAIVRAVMGLGAAFGLTTTAEGVETAEQMACLDLEGCSEVQGYLYSRPVPADEVMTLLARLESEKPVAPSAPKNGS